MALRVFLPLVLTLALGVFTVTGFNVDTRLPTVRTGPEGSMFGFDVSLHIDRDRYWLLVGAPQAETPNRQPHVENGGAIYGCLLHEARCRQIKVDERGSNIQWDGRDYVPVEQKSNQWFGSTVYSSGRDGVIVACAPRYVHFSNALDKREPVGSCWVLRNAMSDIKEYAPCRARLSGHDRQGFCQAGFSAAVSDDGGQLVLGAVGSFFWQGQVFVQDLNHAEKHNETMERPPREDNSYLGYSVAPGHFSNNPTQDFAVGMPKGNELMGKVVLYTNNLRNITEVYGEQIGEYFGYSIAASDFNGDGLDDVAVGAPFHSDYTTETYESGAVYVHYQNPQETFLPDKRTLLRGKKTSRARFGLAVSAIGDINNDGFNDLAVGAPYDGEDGNGAVYIFHGSPEGVQAAMSQIIYAVDIDDQLATFGYSLSSGLDMDNNGYPDILVGAYEANRVVLLRARPIVQMTAEVTLVPEIINLDEKSCTLEDGSPVVCFNVSTCLSYTGKNVPDDIELRLEWRLDWAKNHSQRAFYLDHGDTVTELSALAKLDRRTHICVMSTVYVRDSIRDKLNPIGIQLNYTLHEALPLPRRLTPILDVPNIVTAKGQILKYCGSDNLCIPDLAIFANSKTKVHVIGWTQEMNLAIQVKNLGEDAFESLVKVQLPEGVSYINVLKVKSPLPVTCSSSSDQAHITTVVCDIGNPLPAGALVHVILKLSAAKVNGSSELLTFLLHANSSNPENDTDLSDNYSAVDVPVRAKVNIRVTGVSKPEQILYNSSHQLDTVTSEADVGPEVIHLYEVRNLGPSSVKSLSVVIHWPSTLEDGQNLLYLPTMPQVVRGQGSCTTDVVNPYNLTVVNKDVDEGMYLAFQSLKKKRHRREVEEDGIKEVSCSEDDPGCTLIRCHSGFMAKDDSVLIQVRSRIWINTVLMMQPEYSVLVVSSQVVAEVTDVPYSVKSRHYSVDSFQVDTTVAALGVPPQRGKLKIWILVLAIVGGFVLLLLLVLLLWACGFFKRTRHEDRERLHTDAGNDNHGNGNGNQGNANTAPHYDSVPSDEF
ncbi:hypothetical protein NP493_580g01067 [Ridgeia piscesae]|uniref:Integrin alpha-2 domain-containing protein n=1 Tax=Ridgeia piscesae TaxID=27915 RepID=A0AAD9KUJ5_RIDPI|nr:hypothetical protein NP493_580g01067 [Ridgeia piscesae]